MTSATNAPKTGARTVKVVQDNAAFGALSWASKAGELTGRTLIEVTSTGSGMRAHTYANRIDTPHNGPEYAVIGTPLGNGWLIELAQEHSADDIHITDGLVRQMLHSRGVDDINNPAGAKALAKDCAYVAQATGATVTLAHPTWDGGKEAPAPEPLRRGEPVGIEGVFHRGYVTREVPAGLAMRGLLTAMKTSDRTWGGHAVVPGVGVEVLWCPPDRLVAQKFGSAARDVYVVGRQAKQTPGEWLSDAVLALESDLLVVDVEAAARLDLDVVAMQHKIGVAVVA